MPHPDVQAVGVVDQVQKLQHVLIIIQRLPDAHQDDIRNGNAGIQLGKEHLIQHLRRL